MGEYRGMKALELWCKRITEGYPGVKIDNMTTSWRDGLGFCAIINHFRPDLIDFAKLNKDDIFRNNELAFRVAQQYLGIPALLDAEDMVEYPVPDRLSILTYLSQFYQALACTPGNGPSRISPKRPATVPERSIHPSSASPPAKMAARSSVEPAVLPRRETCVACKLPVFLVERVLVGKQLYHAGCFCCARCAQPMSAGNYYEMAAGGGYCCEVCPTDEAVEVEEQIVPKTMSVLERSVSDEDKSASFYQSALTTASPTIKSQVSSEYTRARSFFMQDLIAEKPPPLPVAKPPDTRKSTEVRDNSASCLPTTDSMRSVSVNNSVRNWDNCRDVSTKEIKDRECDESVVIVPNKEDSVIVISDESKSHISISDDSSFITQTVDDYERSEDDKVEEIDLTKDCSTEDKTKVEEPHDIRNKLDVQLGLEQDNRLDDVSKDVSFKDVKEQSLNIDLDVGVQPLNNDHNEQISSPEQVQEKEEEPVIKPIPRMRKGQSRVSDVKPLSGSTGDTPEIYMELHCTRESIPATFHLPETPTPTPRDVTNPFEDDDEGVTVKKEEVKSLNPFSDDEDEGEVEGDNGLQLPKEEVSMNPFDDEDETIETPVASPIHKQHVSQQLKRVPCRIRDCKQSTGDTPEILYKRESLPPKYVPPQRESSNPFSSDDDDDDEEEDAFKITHSQGQLKRLELRKDSTSNDNDVKLEYKRESIHPSYQIPDFEKKPTPRISLNPFSSDEDDADDLPANTHGSLSSVAQQRSSFGSSASLASTASSSVNSTYRKKKPAPKPPIPTFSGQVNSANSSPQASITSSPSTSAQHSPRPRKSKRAPPPPITAKATSTPIGLSSTPSVITFSPIKLQDYDKAKNEKDEANRNMQNQALVPRDKSTYGKWKRKKHQAPSLPIPQKRTIKALPMTELKKELDIIEVQLQGLSKQGVRLEQIIRDQCEGPDADPNATDIPIEAEDLILQLFEVVNEKNELCRRQAELMYLKRQHRLEVEQAEIEYQIRVLMLQSCKTDSEKAQETELIARLVEIVDMRAEIVECLEMDRVRGVEEDDSILYSMNTYANKRDDAASTQPSSNESTPKKDKKKKLRKLLKFKKFTAGHKVDADKDVDESETNSSRSAKSSKSKKKK